jgi:hypothetical protein
MLPKKRTRNLLVEEIGDESVVYDLERDRVHRLNQTTARVWALSNGRRTVADVAARLGRELGVAGCEPMVWMALDQLERAYLLAEPLGRTSTARALSRREAIALGLTGAAAFVLPGCESVTAPSPQDSGIAPPQVLFQYAEKCAMPNQAKAKEIVAIVPQGRVELKSTRTGSNQKPFERKLQLKIGEGGVCAGKCDNKPCQGFLKSGKWSLVPATQTVADIVGPDDQTEVTVRARPDVALFTNITLRLEVTIICSVKCKVCNQGFLEECESAPVTITLERPVSVNPAKAR